MKTQCLRCGQSTHMVDECPLPVLPDSRVLGPATSRTLEKEMDEQPEALRLAAWLNEGAWHQMKLGDVEAAGRELRRQHADIERKDALLRQALDALEKSRPLAYHFDAWEEALRALNKELSALPPLPSPKWLDTHQGPQRAFTADQMQAYAQQARASLESKNKRLREMLQGVLMMGRGTSGRIIIEGWQEDVIRAALKEQP